MAEMKHFRLPDVGEGLTEAEIVSWKVRPGDTVKVNETVVEIETAKSLVELPCPYAGTVSELLVEEGQTVNVGTPIIAVDTGGAGPSKPPVEAAAATDPSATELRAAVSTPRPDEAVEPGLIGGPAPGGRTSVLVGYGPRSGAARRRPRKAGAVPAGTSAAAAQSAVQAATEGGPPDQPEVRVEDAPTNVAAPTESPVGESDGTGGRGAGEAASRVVVLAKPPVRKLAKDLGVDLADVQATGPHGTVSRRDVEEFAAAAGGRPPPLARPAPARAGEQETRVPVRGVRKMTAQAMVASAFTAPHVTEWVTVDVSPTMRLVKRLRAHRDFRDVKVSPLLLVARACCLAMRRTPEVNATWDGDRGEIVLKHYVHLGIAAATPRGLVVPNIKDADAMPLPDLARALGELTATARQGKTQPAEMSGGTFTITNVGVFGVDSGTPILNPGESAILAFGAVRRQPWVHRGAVRPRWVTQLALSFDHRIVDGQQGSRFLADVAAILANPGLALLH